MTTKILYISIDGEEFETADECLKYEKKRDASGAVIMFTRNRLPILDVDSVTAFEDAHYLYILDAERAKKFFDYVSESYGYAVPNPDEVVDHSLFAFEDSSYAQSFFDVNDRIADLEVLKDELLDRAKECLDE